MVEEVSFLKKDFKQKENKYLTDFLDIKTLKEKVEDKLIKQDQSLQIVHMLCRPRLNSNALNRVVIGYKNPLCLTRAKQVQHALYNGHEIIKDNHTPAILHNSEDTLEIAEITRKKINDKMNDPECVTRKVKISPHDYSKENLLATFTPQKQLTPEQIFWSNDLMKLKSEALKERTKVSRPLKAFTVYPLNTPAALFPKVPSTKSQVKIHIFTLIQLFSEFDQTCKKRITPTAITGGERGFEQTKACYLQKVIPFFKTLKDNFEGIQKALTKEVKEMKDVFEELEAEPRSSPKSVGASEAEEVPAEEPQVADEEADYQKAMEESMKVAYALPKGPLPPVVIREPESGKYQPLLEVPGKGKAKVTEKQVAHDLLNSEEESEKVTLRTEKGGQDEGQAGPDLDAQAEDQTGSDAGAQAEGQAGSNPDETSEGQAGPDPGDAEARVQPILSHVVHAGSDRKHMDLDVADVSPQPSTEQLDEGFTATVYPNVQENLKLAVDEPVLLEEPASSSGTLSSLQHLTLSSISLMTSPIIDLTSRPKSPNEPQQIKANTTDTTTTTTVTLPPPQAPQQSTTEAMMVKCIGELEHIMADLIQVNKNMEVRLDKHGARLYTLEQLDIPQQVSIAVSEVVTDAVDWAMQAPLCNRFRDLPEADMKEILYQRIWESDSYKSHKDHMHLFKALEKSMKRDHSEELAQDLAEVRKKRKKGRESPKTPPGSPSYQPPPPPPPAGPSGASGAPRTGDIATFMDWFCKRRGITELKPQDLKGPAYEIVKFFHPDVIHLQYQMEECYKLLTDGVDDPILRHNVSKPLPLGGPPGQVIVQSDFFFNKDMEYLRYCSKGRRPALSISKMKAAYYPDAGIKQLVPDQFWIEKECKYDIAAMYGISHWWFQRQRFYIDRHTSEGDRSAVRTYMRILSVVRIKVFSMYGYDYMKKIVLRRADLNEHVIAERDFKYLYPSDFEDLNLLNLQEDFQLGIESYQTQVNLTKPQWTATGFEYKHDYTVIESPRAVIFRDKYGDQKIDFRFKYEVLVQEGRRSVQRIHVRDSEAFEDTEDLSQPGELCWLTR
nr:hypothetical protein [Tanacetum cinerariifolium]